MLIVNLYRLHTVCCEVKLLQKTALNKHIFQKHLLLLVFSKIGQKIKPHFSKKCNLWKPFLLFLCQQKKRKRINPLSYVVSFYYLILKCRLLCFLQKISICGSELVKGRNKLMQTFYTLNYGLSIMVDARPQFGLSKNREQYIALLRQS